MYLSNILFPLFSFRSCQLRSNLNVQYDDGSELNKIPSTFMRQMDLVKMENMSPSDFLYRTADIYGVNKKRLEFVLGLVKPFFAAKTRKDRGDNELTTIDPFCRVSIRECSGGQRRMLAIAAALFQNTSFLLLDEPLSGIDSASSEKIVNLLNYVSKVNNVTILMTLHQPSDDILRKMDSVLVLGKGNVIFRGKFGSGKELQELHKKKSSAADLIHDIIVKDDDKTRTSRDESNDETTINSDSDTESTSTLSSDDDDQNVRNDKPSRSPLWQVQPIIKRLYKECPPDFQDVFVLPFCVLIISLWGRLDSDNPMQSKFEQRSQNTA